MLRRATRAELRKLATVWTTWLAVGISVLLAAATAALAAASPNGAAGRTDAFAGMSTAVIGVIVLACLAAGEEYAPRRRSEGVGARQVVDSLRAVPSRGAFLAAKALAVGVVTLIAAAVGIAVALAVSWIVAGGIPTFGWSVVAGTALYWVLTAWLALGFAVLLRNGIVPMVLLIVNHSMVSLSLLLSMLTPLARYLPDAAGMRLLGPPPPFPFLEPLAVVPGALVLAAWSLVPLGAAWLVLRRRDA